MRYAISNWIYGDEPLSDTFNRLHQYGYQGIELVGEPTRYSVSEIKSLCEKFKIDITSVLGWCIWGIPGRDACSPNEEEREAALTYGKECIDLASEVGAPIFVVLPAPAGRTTPTGSPKVEEEWLSAYQAEWELAVDSVRKLADYALDRGVVLGLEPINRYETFLVTNLNQAMKFLSVVGSENLKIHLDTFHMNLEEPDLATVIRQAGKLLVNMHVSDSNREAPGRGHIDFASLMEALYDIEYDGALVLEPVPPGADPLLMVKMSKYLDLRDVYAEEGIRHLKQFEK
jgi:sugar phosphate isomerase/epimerase